MTIDLVYCSGTLDRFVCPAVLDYAPLRFLSEPESVTVWPNNDSVTLRCVAEPPDATIRWTVNGSDDVSGHVVEAGTIQFGPGSSGSWSDADLLGNGGRVYRCLATSAAGTVVSREATVSLARECDIHVM